LAPGSPRSLTPCSPSSHAASRPTRSSSRPSQSAIAFALLTNSSGCYLAFFWILM
jgi:hypothetical protein